MTIRQRTLALLGTSVVVMGVVLWVLMSSGTLRSLERLERQGTAVDRRWLSFVMPRRSRGLASRCNGPRSTGERG